MVLALCGREASELKRVKELEERNARFKHMYANSALELDTEKYIIEKKSKALQKKRIIEDL